MIIGYYFHTRAKLLDGKLFIDGFQGVFIEDLARRFDEVVIIMHCLDINEKDETLNWVLDQPNIRLLNLGKKEQAWKRELKWRQILGRHRSEFKKMNKIIVRSPSPLAPYFARYVELESKIYFMVVSDYREGAKEIKIFTLRSLAIKIYILRNNRLFMDALSHGVIVANSQKIKSKLERNHSNVFFIPTTTLREEDFYIRNLKADDRWEILFTGRLVEQKGLLELIEAFSLLIQKQVKCRLNIVGWEEIKGGIFTKRLKMLAETLGVKDDIVFHGFKKVGFELNALYRSCNLYVLPTYHEGFPRTIWEAMANGLPVVTTNVGSIPKILDNGKHALVVEPRDSMAIYKSILTIIENDKIRHNLVKNGYELAKNNTVEAVGNMWEGLLK